MRNIACTTPCAADHISNNASPQAAITSALHSLRADIILLQADMAQENEAFSKRLEPGVQLLCCLIRGDYSRQELVNFPMWDMRLEKLRDAAHELADAFTPPSPHYLIGSLAARLLKLHARINETLLLVSLLPSEMQNTCTENAQYALNRLAHGVYYLYCRQADAKR